MSKSHEPGNEIFKVGKADDQNLPASTRNKITKSLAKINHEKVSKALVSILGQAELSSDFIKHLQRGKVYLAEIPKKLQQDFDDGKLRFMNIKETGEQVGEIVGPNNFGTRAHVIVKDASIVHSNIPHDLTTIAIQQQLAQMAAVWDEVRARIEEMQKTYDKSLLGELRGMRDQLTQVRSVEDVENKKDLIRGAITQLNLTRGKAIERLIDELEKMPNVPATYWKRFFKILIKEGYKANVISSYEKVQELFSYYLAASQLLAYAFALLGEESTYEDIFSPDPVLLKGEPLHNLKRSEEIVDVSGEQWYSKPSKYLGLIKSEAERLFLQDKDQIVIEVTGAELLEAIDNVKREQAKLENKA